MVERVIEPEVLTDRKSQTALRRKIGIAQRVLRTAGGWHTKLCGPPRPCMAGWRPMKHADCRGRLAPSGWTHVALLLVWRFLPWPGTAGAAGTRGAAARRAASSTHRPSTIAFRAWLNISPTM